MSSKPILITLVLSAQISAKFCCCYGQDESSSDIGGQESVIIEPTEGPVQQGATVVPRVPGSAEVPPINTIEEERAESEVGSNDSQVGSDEAAAELEAAAEINQPFIQGFSYISNKADGKTRIDDINAYQGTECFGILHEGDQAFVTKLVKDGAGVWMIEGDSAEITESAQPGPSGSNGGADPVDAGRTDPDNILSTSQVVFADVSLSERVLPSEFGSHNTLYACLPTDNYAQAWTVYKMTKQGDGSFKQASQKDADSNEVEKIHKVFGLAVEEPVLVPDAIPQPSGGSDQKASEFSEDDLPRTLNRLDAKAISKEDLKGKNLVEKMLDGFSNPLDLIKAKMKLDESQLPVYLLIRGIGSAFFCVLRINANKTWSVIKLTIKDDIINEELIADSPNNIITEGAKAFAEFFKGKEGIESGKIGSIQSFGGSKIFTIDSFREKGFADSTVEKIKNETIEKGIPIGESRDINCQITKNGEAKYYKLKIIRVTRNAFAVDGVGGDGAIPLDDKEVFIFSKQQLVDAGINGDKLPTNEDQVAKVRGNSEGKKFVYNVQKVGEDQYQVLYGGQQYNKIQGTEVFIFSKDDLAAKGIQAAQLPTNEGQVAEVRADLESITFYKVKKVGDEYSVLDDKNEPYQNIKGINALKAVFGRNEFYEIEGDNLSQALNNPKLTEVKGSKLEENKYYAFLGGGNWSICQAITKNNDIVYLDITGKKVTVGASANSLTPAIKAVLNAARRKK